MESRSVSVENLGRNPRSIYHGLSREQKMFIKELEYNMNITDPAAIQILIDVVKKKNHLFSWSK